MTTDLRSGANKGKSGKVEKCNQNSWTRKDKSLNIFGEKENCVNLEGLKLKNSFSNALMENLPI
jgi:hypothetical protein